MMNGEHLDLICNGDGDLSTFGELVNCNTKILVKIFGVKDHFQACY